MTDRVRLATPEDVPFFCQWYQQAGRKLNPALLPRTTFVTDREGIPVAGLALYLTQGAPVAFIDHAMACQNAPHAAKVQAFRELVRSAVLVAETMGCQVVQAAAPEAIANLLHSTGWADPVPLHCTAFVCSSQQPLQ